MLNNLYPNAANKPRFSFDVPILPPDVEPDAADEITVVYNPAWSPVLAGALTQLLLYATWEGTDAEKLLATQRAANLIDQLMTPVTVSDKVPAPYWDSGADVGDEATPAEQTWYGHVSGGDFVEDITVWLFGGFLAQTVSPQAALLYTTYERKMRLAFLSEGVAGFAHVIIDEISQGRIDLSGDAGQVLEQDFMTDGTEGAHTVMVVYETE